MGSKLYVVNLAYAVTDRDLRQLFGRHGTVRSVQVIMDRETGRSRGFGFVEMASDREAQAALRALHGTRVQGRPLIVTEARPKEVGAGPRRPGPARGVKGRKRPPALGRRLRRPRPEAGSGGAAPPPGDEG